MNNDHLNDRLGRDDPSSPADVPLTERERRYRTLFGAMEEGFCVVEMTFDEAGKPIDYSFLEFNDAFERMTGITAEAVLAGKSARELYPTLEEHWFEAYGRVATTGESVRFENGVEAMGKWFDVHAFRVGGEGSREVGVLFKDAGERRRAEIERERLLVEARERERFLGLVTDRLPVRIGYLDQEYRYQFVNGEYERAFGLPPGVGVGLTVAEMAGDEAFRISKPFLDRALAGDTHTQEFSVPYAFGERRVEVQYVPDRSETGEVRGLVIHVLDVTDRYAMTQALREREERYRTLFDSLEEGFCVFEMIFDEAGKPIDYRFKEVNKAFAAHTGLREEDVLGGKTIREMVPNHEPAWFKRYGRVAQTGEPLVVEDRAEALGRWYSIHAFRIGGEGSVEVGALFKDTTEEHAAQLAIKEERARQDRTLETAQVATFDWHIPVDRLYGNPLLNQFFGIDVPHGEGVPVARYFESIHPEDRELVRQALEKSVQEGNRYEVQYRVIGFEGRERWVLTRGDTTQDPEARPLRVSGIVFDVTERVRADEALRESEARRTLALDSGKIGSWNIDLQTMALTGDPRFWTLFGGAGESFGYEEAFAIIHPDDRQKVREGVEAACRPVDPVPYAAEYRVVHPDGSVHWLSAAGHANIRQEGPDKVPASLDGTVIDITERKRAEEDRERLVAEIQVEREKLQSLFQQAPAFIAVLTGSELTFEYVNEAYYGLVGHREIVGKPLIEALPEVAGQGYLERLQSVMATGEPMVGVAMPVLLQRNSGMVPEERFMDLTYQPARERNGSIYGVLAHGVDVTEQVRSRQAISEREELFRTVFEGAGDDAIIVMEEDRTITAWNPAAERISGWSAEEAIGQVADMIFTPEDRARSAPLEETGKAARDGKAVDERWHLRRDGSRFWGSGTMNALHDEAGNVHGYLKVFRDATARYEEAKTLAFLRMLTDALVGQRALEGIVGTVERMLGEHLGASRVAFVEVRPDGESIAIRQEWGPGMPSLVGAYRLDAFGDFVAGELRAGRTHVSYDAARESGEESDLATVTAYRIGSGISVPVLTDGRLTSVVVVHQATARAWTADEVGLVRQVADRMSSEIERWRAEAALRASEERFRVVQETAPEPFAIMEAVRDGTDKIVDFRWTYLNPATERMTGERNADMIGASVLERRPAMRDNSELFRSYVRSVETGEPFTLETPLSYAGREYYMLLTVSKVGDGVATSFTDLTERYVEAQTLAFLSLLTEAIIDQRDADAIIDTSERMLGQYLGVSRVTFGELWDDGDTVAIRREWGPDAPSIAGTRSFSAFGERINGNLRAGRTDLLRDAEEEFAGEPLLEILRAAQVRAAVSVPILKDGRLVSVFVVHQDTVRDWTADEIGLVQQVADRMSAEIERARAEGALRTSEERFRQLVELSPSTVWFGEIDGGLSYISQDFYDATGLTPEMALPNGWASTIHPDDFAGMVAEWETARREETVYDTEFRIRHRNGEYRWLGVRALPVRDGEGRVTGWLGNNSDIQEQKETEETLRARVEERTAELQRAVREAEGFNYSISHDLRTPLRAMVSTSSILLEELGDDLDEEHRSLLVRQAENAKRLGRLIDELLRLSRLARVPVNRERLDMTWKARSVAQEIEESGGVNVCRFEVQEGMTAEGDAGLVRTVLHNLIGNACKFSPQGGTVRIRQEGGVFSVADEGVGFDMQFAPKIFLPFERLVAESEFEGTGIGLANVKRIVERHGGRVWVESESGVGTTFFFTLEA